MEQSGDAHVGQTLTRLAMLAAASHRHEATQQLAATSLRQWRDLNPKRDRLAVVHPPRTDAGAIHTEVDR